MRFGRLLRRRAAAQVGLLALVGVVAGLVCATLVAVLGQVALSAQAGLTDALHRAGPTGAAMQLATPRDDRDPDGQASAGDQDLAQVLAGLPVSVERSYRSTPLAVGRHAVDAAADPALARLVEVVDGELDGAAPPGRVAVSASQATADVLGARVGDQLALTGASTSADPLQATLVAVWRPLDAADPRWFAAADGAVWLDQADLDAVPATVRVRWTLVPDAAALAPSQVPELRAALAESLAALKADDAVDLLGVLGTEGLDATLAEVDTTLSTVRALSLPATLLAALVGVVVLGQLAALLVEVRHGELVLLRSRGASGRRLVASAAVEGAAVGALGAALGSAAAALGLRSLGDAPLDLVLGAPLAVAGAVAAVLATATWLRVRRPLREERADRPLRSSTLLGAVALAAGAAGLGLWRLIDLGSPVRLAAGRASADPLATAALALGLLAAALLVAAVVPPAARAVGGLAARRSDLRVLAVQEVARRPSAHTASAALVTLAVATAVVVAVFLGSWTTLHQLRQSVQNGADLRVVTEARSVPDVERVVTSAVTGTTVTADVQTATFGGVTATLVAVPGQVWPLLHHSPQDPAFDPATASGSAPGDGGSGDGGSGDAVRVVMTRALAGALSLEVGDRTSLVVPGHTVPVEVAALVHAVPGSDEPRALLVELDAWASAQRATGSDPAPVHEVWAWARDGAVAGGGTAAVAELAAALRDAGLDAQVTGGAPTPTPLLDPALAAFRLATWATVALAAGGALAAARAGARARRTEIGALRGLGMTGRRQAATRVVEHTRVLTPAVLGGTVAGLGLASLVVVPLVRALDDGSVALPVPLGLDVTALAWWLGSTLAALAVVVGSVARDTAARARDASPREVAR